MISCWLWTTVFSTFLVWLNKAFRDAFSSSILSSVSFILELSCVIRSLLILIASESCWRESLSSLNISSLLFDVTRKSFCNRSTSSKRALFDFSETPSRTSSCRNLSSDSDSMFKPLPAKFPGLLFLIRSGTTWFSGFGRGDSPPIPGSCSYLDGNWLFGGLTMKKNKTV